MIFNRLKVWVRIINLPFGYMNKKWGTLIAGPIGCEGSVPSVDCDASGRCWGSFMRARVELNVDEPLRRGVTIFSQRRNATDWFDVQYENLPRFCFSCGLIGHSSTECKNPGERDVDGKLPYSADRLCAPDEWKKKNQGPKPSSGSASTEQGRTSVPTNERPGQSTNKSGAAGKQHKPKEHPEASAPEKVSVARAHANASKAGKSSAKEKNTGQEGQGFVGQKRKSQQVYRVKENPLPIDVAPNPKAIVVFQDLAAQVDDSGHARDVVSNDSNKKLKKSDFEGSADRAGAVEQPRRTQ
jgi:hypothetical protein